MEIYISFDLNVMTIEITLVLPLYLKESVFQWSFSLSTCSWNPMVASFPNVIGPRAFQVFLQFSHLFIFESSLHLLVLVALLLLILYSFVHNPASTYTCTSPPIPNTCYSLTCFFIIAFGTIKNASGTQCDMNYARIKYWRMINNQFPLLSLPLTDSGFHKIKPRNFPSPYPSMAQLNVIASEINSWNI